MQTLPSDPIHLARMATMSPRPLVESRMIECIAASLMIAAPRLRITSEIDSMNCHQEDLEEWGPTSIVDPWISEAYCTRALNLRTDISSLARKKNRSHQISILRKKIFPFGHTSQTLPFRSFAVISFMTSQ